MVFFSFFKKSNKVEPKPKPKINMCDRVDCTNVHSRLILDGTMRICESCYKEIEDYKAAFWYGSKTKKDIYDRILSYMRHVPPGELMPILKKLEIDKEFNRLMGNKENE